MSIITVLLGAVILFNPVQSLALLTRICGVVLMIAEVISIFEGFSIISRVGKIKKVENEIKKEYKNIKSGK